jgi:hypothetical protein
MLEKVPFFSTFFIIIHFFFVDTAFRIELSVFFAIWSTFTSSSNQPVALHGANAFSHSSNSPAVSTNCISHLGQVVMVITFARGCYVLLQCSS